MRLGTTTFSFTNEWLTRRFTRAELLERAAAFELGPGLEVVGQQLWRGYPILDRDEVVGFRRLCDRLGFEPAAIGGYVDLLRRPGTRMTLDECVDALEAQIGVAARLGFPVIRLHVGVPIPAIERVVPSAERVDVVLATELQGPQTPDDPAVQALLELRERVGGLRTWPSSSTSASRCAPSRRRSSTPSAVPACVVTTSTRSRSGGVVVRLSASSSARSRRPVPPTSRKTRRARGSCASDGRIPHSWAPLVSLVAHAHAKFWELDAAGDEPTIDNRAVLDVLLAGGFQGFVASEWGGSAWVDADDVDGFSIVAQHRRLLGRLVQQAPASAPA